MTGRRGRGRDGEQDGGFALLIVLWTLVLLSFLVSVVVTSADRQLRTVYAMRRAAQMRAAADGEIWVGIFHALDRSPGHWNADGREHVQTAGGLTSRIRLASEAGLVNPNIASRALLAALLQVCGAQKKQADDIAANMVQWRSTAGQGNAARTKALYLAAGRPYTPPGDIFRSMDEIGLVLGMTPGLLRAVRPYLSVTQQNDPDLAVADPAVRRALDMAGAPHVRTSPEGGKPVTLLVTVAMDDGQGGHASRRATVLVSPGARAGQDLAGRVHIVALGS
ncbi:general secretion pathway protein GspK [Gluconacetobacter azotocaptans]|uniref:type II secretion system protein GspK n=1 Tax=Gluconacetobacter azotocaptans TaxID=142834 RepID=UPI0019572D28|nr:general secretion pathway protein GspK [Gluconacetobacter azotocaptans]